MAEVSLFILRKKRPLNMRQKSFSDYVNKKKNVLSPVDKKYLQYNFGSCMYARKITIILRKYKSK